MTSAAKPPVAATMLVGLGLWLGACADRPPAGQFTGTVGNPYNALGVCQHTCTPDPGPAAMTGTEYGCQPGSTPDVEFNPSYLWTFEESDATGINGRAFSMYSYTDSTHPIDSFFVEDQGLQVKETWQPPTSVLARCGNPSNRVIHIQGGPFLGWGGGVGIAMLYYAGKIAPPSADPAWSAATLAAMTDLSAWDGISFWARRGPDSQGGIRVLLGDKNTDDDVSYLMWRDTPNLPRYCERVRECACFNHQACTVVTTEDVMTKRVTIPGVCAPPGTDPNTPRSFCGTPAPYVGGGNSPNGGSVQCNTCEQSRCDEVYPAYPNDAHDPQFLRKPCTPFSYRNGVSSLFCYDPSAGETVADTTEQCGDHWTTPVNLSNDWRLYFVPFNSMTQQGWAKRFASLDTTAASTMRFTWDGGWIDYYIDDVTFYRHRRNDNASATP